MIPRDISPGTRVRVRTKPTALPLNLAPLAGFIGKFEGWDEQEYPQAEPVARVKFRRLGVRLVPAGHLELA